MKKAGKKCFLRLISLAAASSLLLCLCLCSCAVGSSRESEDVAAYEDDSSAVTVTIFTYGSEPTESNEQTTAESEIPSETEITTEPAFPDESPIESEIRIENEPAKEFSLPDEFFEELALIFEKYGVNLSCTGEDTDCGCDPDRTYEDEEGNILTEKTVSIYFCDLTSGYEITINPAVHYAVASTVKIPYCVYIYEKIETGEIGSEEILIYKEKHFFEGTGIIKDMEFGAEFTVLELLELAITESDNVAFQMLKDLCDWEEFSLYLSENGCTHSEDTRLSKEKICTESAGVYAKVLAEYLTSGGEYSEIFGEHLLSTKNKMIRSHYDVYRKYGWAENSFHDIAYIDAPYPYTLAILTNLGGEDTEDYGFYSEVSYLFERYSQELRETVEEEE